MAIELETYSTSDLGCAAFLLTKAVPLIRIDRTGPKAYFLFGEPLQAEEIAQGFYTGVAQVSARLLFDSERHLKNLLHQDNANPKHKL